MWASRRWSSRRTAGSAGTPDDHYARRPACDDPFPALGTHMYVRGTLRANRAGESVDSMGRGGVLGGQRAQGVEGNQGAIDAAPQLAAADPAPAVEAVVLGEHHQH